MPACPFDFREVAWGALACALALTGPAVQAMTVRYECTGHRWLTAELTPREGRVHFEGLDATVVRVPDAHEARYVNARAGIVIVTRMRAMTFTKGGEVLACELRSDALSPQNLGVSRPASSSAGR